jgi:hypothetical protein
MNKLMWFLKTILLDQCAENEGAGAGAGDGSGAGDGGDGQGGAPENGQGGAPGAGDDQDAGDGNGAGAGQGSQQPVFGKYKTAEELWQAHQDLTKKTSQTELNTAKLRKTLESAGIKIGQDDDGNTILIPVENKKERTKKFSDEQKKKLGMYFGDDPEKGVESAQGFLSLMQPFIEDLLEDQFYTREKAYNQRNSQVSQFRKTQDSSNNRMLKMFPQLVLGSDDRPNEQFNESFYNRATEIWKNTPEYMKDARGELLAALDAADELGIVANVIKQAKQEGVKFGQQNKKVLVPAGGGQGKVSQNGKAVSKAEYLAMTPDQRDAHDRAQLQVAR